MSFAEKKRRSNTSSDVLALAGLKLTLRSWVIGPLYANEHPTVSKTFSTGSSYSISRDAFFNDIDSTSDIIPGRRNSIFGVSFAVVSY